MIHAIVQARMSSRRLPGKVLEPLAGEPMILRQLERIGRSRLDGVIVATSTDSTDDVLHERLRAAGVASFRGALDDVLDRVYRAAASVGASHVVRLTADCPLVDHRIIDRVVAEHLTQRNDYTSNTLVRTFPDGLDVEAVTFAALEAAWREAREQPHREHVTPFVHTQPRRFRLGNVVSAADQAHRRLTVDYAEDLAVVRAVFDALYARDAAFSFEEIVALLDGRPELERLNARHNLYAIRDAGSASR